jgi:hypothetical protein
MTIDQTFLRQINCAHFTHRRDRTTGRGFPIVRSLASLSNHYCARHEPRIDPLGWPKRLVTGQFVRPRRRTWDNAIETSTIEVNDQMVTREGIAIVLLTDRANATAILQDQRLH